MAIRHEQLATFTADATTGTTTNWSAPTGAKGAIFYIDLSAVAGTTPIFDAKLQYKDLTGGDAVDIDSATFAQLTAAGQVSLYVYPGLTSDATGNQKRINDVLPRAGRVVTTQDRTTADETYTYTISVDWLD